MLNMLYRRGIILCFIAIYAVLGCSHKRPQPQLSRPTIHRLCVLPAGLAGSVPMLSEADQQAIRILAQSKIADSLLAILPPEVTLVRPSSPAEAQGCDAHLITNIFFLKLVKKEDAQKSAAISAAGLVLGAVVGVGFITLPSAQMAVSLSLTEKPTDHVLWQTTEQMSHEVISFKGNYTSQASNLLNVLAERIQKQFPIQKPKK